MARQRRTAWATALVLTAALVAPVASAPMADAKPSKPTPTAKAVRDAKAAAAAATRAVLAARAAQSTAQSRLDLLDSRLETAIEHLNAARAAADAAAGVLAHRQQVSAQATQTSITAQLSVDRLASDSYKAGTDLSGGLGELAAVLDSTPDGLQGLVAGINALGQVASGRRKDVEQAANLHLAALQAEAAALVASRDLAAKQTAAAAAKDAVAAQEKAQKVEVARLNAQLSAAARTLRNARSTAATLAHDRAVALARIAAEAAAAERARQLAGGSSGGHPPTDSGGGSGSAWGTGQSVTTYSQRVAALNWARTQIGKPYIAGDAGPNSYDCSGLTQWAYLKVGHAMIHFSQSQYEAGQKIPYSQLQPGDLVFFGTNSRDWTTIHHVAIYAGHDTMVEAPHTGGHVQEVGIWWAQLMPYGVRP